MRATRAGRPDYKLVHHASNGRSVYSFCMAGGTVGGHSEEAAWSQRMSQYSRNERNANQRNWSWASPRRLSRQSGDPNSVLAGSNSSAMGSRPRAGRKNYGAGQRVATSRRAPSENSGSTALYTPGVTPTDLSTALPDTPSPQSAKPCRFDSRSRFCHADAVLTAWNALSPVRIKRNEHFSINTGLYRGEGAAMRAHPVRCGGRHRVQSGH